MGTQQIEWSQPDRHGHVTATVRQPGGILRGPRAPEREGYEVFFVGRHGTHSTFTYRPRS